ncbi:MAG: tRNA (adenosine(37)-N6)-threonylcarbamoyltransferase complex dimerization subunit type 1 TsaB [Rhodospirillales bacterium]|nr:tRNA (adenosine(37)-N6)-threonylcarbamoyltransferase complex dimerization subunit type 1 TsaB [Rhodospirillales bacterium]
MIVLGIDSATDSCSVAVWIDGRIAARRFVPMARGHAEALMPMIVSVVGEAAIEFAAIELVAATVGPGSFTGLRVGLAAARGIGVALSRPVVGVTTLEALAHPFVDSGRAVLVTLDDKRGGFYAQTFGPAGEALASPAAVDAVGLARLAPGCAFAVIGDGAAAASRALVAAGHAPTLSDATARPDAAVIATIAARRHAAETSLAATPLYVHPPATTLASGRRVAISTDASRVAELHRHCIGDAWDEAGIANLLSEGSGFALLIRDGDRAVGYVFARVIVSESEILGIGVSEASRRRGIGRDLIRAAVAEAKVRGASRVVLEVAANNLAAKALYVAEGFAVVGERRGYYARTTGAVDAVVMARTVAS